MMRDVKDDVKALQPGMENHEESGVWERGDLGHHASEDKKGQRVPG